MSARQKGWKWFGRRNDKVTKFRQAAPRCRLLRLELLEDRTMPSITAAITSPAPTWTAIGPTVITGGQDEGLTNQLNPVAGAVVAFAAAPNNPNVVFAATANGGIWETTNINATTTVDVNQINVPSLPVAPDASKMTAGGNAATPNGTIFYKVTFVDSTGVESNASQAVAFSPGDTSWTLRNIPTGPTFTALNLTTASRNIYRLITGSALPAGVAPYYALVGTIMGNDPSATFVDNVAVNPPASSARLETIPSPNWVPLTDNFPSLSMSALTVVPDPSVGYVLYAGTGNVSSSRQGSGAGLLISTNAGATWSQVTSDMLTGLTITGIQIIPGMGNARTVVIATSGTDANPGGVFLINIPDITAPSQNVTISRPPGLPNASVSDLASVPAAAAPGVAVNGNPVLFAAVTPGSASGGVVPGIYQSTDGGNTWSPSAAWQFLNGYLATSPRIRFGVYSNTTTGKFALYAGVIQGSALAAIYRYDNLVGNVPSVTLVTPYPLNLSLDNGTANGLNPGNQGDIHFSMVVDPNNPYTVYVGGDRQPSNPSAAGNSDFTGRIFRFNTQTLPASYTQVTSAYAPGEGPGLGATATEGVEDPKGVFASFAIYKYAISYVDSAGEESALSSTFSITISSLLFEPVASIELANLTAGVPAGARSIKIYRTKADGTQFFYLATVPATTATYTDTTADAQLGMLVAPYQGLAPVPFPTTINGTAVPTPFNPVFTRLATAPAGQGFVPQSTYFWQFVYVNPQGQPSTPSTEVGQYSLTSTGFSINLSAYPHAAGDYWLVYRTGANDQNYRLVGVLNSANNYTLVDTTPDSQRGPALYSIGTAPHADSRAMAFVGNTLIESDDGGIYELTNPNSVVTGPNSVITGAPDYWQALDGNLGNIEIYSTAYDPLGQVAIAGNQDVGSIAETGSLSTAWTALTGGDGGSQAVAVVNPNTASQAVYRYAVGNNFKSINRTTDNANGTAGNTTTIKLASSSAPSAAALSGLDPADQNKGGFVRVQIAVNAVNGQLAVAYYGVYTTGNNGDVVSQQVGAVDTTAPVTALAYGGMNPDGTLAPNVLYWARGGTIYVRSSSFGSINSTPLNGATTISSIVLDPNNWKVAYAAGGGKVFATVDGGQTWTDITGNLVPRNAGLDAVQLIKLPASTDFPYGQDALLVGGANGVYVAYNPLGVPDGTNAYQELAPSASIAAAPGGATETGSTVTITTATALTLATGETVTISNVAEAGYNGTFMVTKVLSPTSFTYTDPTTGLAASGGGSVQTSQITWRALNVGLPNALVTQISYTPTITVMTPSGSQQRGDVLVISTLGRGDYEITAASTKLGLTATNVLTITGDGTDSNARVVISPNAQNPQMIDVRISSGLEVNDYDYSEFSISGINVSNLGTGGTLVIDTGLALLPLGINFNGGGNSNLAFQSLQTATVQMNTITNTSNNSRSIVIDGPNGIVNVTDTNPSGPPGNLPQPPAVRQIGQGLENLTTSSLGQALDLVNLPVIGATLGDALDGVQSIAGQTDPDSGDPDAGSEASNGPNGPGLFERLFEEGTGAFDLNAIGGPSIPDLNTLKQDLLNLSDPSDPGSVTYTQDPTTGYVRFTVAINKTLDGTPNLDLEALGGTVSLTGDVDITMQVHVQLVFGTDAQGFYIDTAGLTDGHGNPLPILTVDHIQVEPDGGFDASGDFGFFDISATNLTLNVGSGIGVAVTLPPESLDTLTGTTTNLLRPQDFATMAAQATATLVAPAGQTVAVSATISVDSGLLGSLIPASLKNLALTFTFNDLSDPTNVTISGPGFTSIGDLINQSKTDILDGLEQLAAFGNEIDASPLMMEQLPVIDRSLGSIVSAGAIFNTGLYQPVQNYFNNLPTLPGGTTELPTVTGLLNAITGGALTASNGDLSLALAPGLSLSVQGGALMLNYAFTATRTDPIALDLGVGGDSPLSLNANVSVNLQTQFSFDASIGLDLTQAANPLNAFFVQLTTPPTITASILGSAQGVQFAGAGQNDLQFTFHDGTSVSVSLNGATTIGAILADLNAAAPGKLTASINASGMGLVLTDGTSGQSPFTVTALNNSPAAAELGILGIPESNGTIQGTNLSRTSALTPTILLAELPLGGGLSVNANIGALQVGGQVLGLPVNPADPNSPRLPLLQVSGSLSLAADSKGRTTLNTLMVTPAGDLFKLSLNGSLALDIPITASLQFASGRSFDFTAGGQPELFIQTPSLFTTAPTITSKNFGTLLSFQNVTAASLLLALDQFSQYLGQYANSPAFNTPIPFTSGKTLGSVVNLAAAFANELAGLKAPDGAPDFNSIQGLQQATTTDPITFNFVPSFQTSTNGTVPALELTFNYTDQFGGTNSGVIRGNILSPLIDDTTTLSTLNGGKGVQFSTTGGADLSIALSNGTTFAVTFSSPKTIGDVIAQIDNASGNNGQIAAAINPDDNGLVLTDLTLGASLFNVLGVQGSSAASGLGLVGFGFGTQTLDPTTPLSHLNNGNGVTFSTTGGPDLMVTLANGNSISVTFNKPMTVGDLISQVAAAPGNNGQLTLGFNANGNGLALYDTTTGNNSLTVLAAPAGLGLAGTAAPRPAITASTLLSQLNAGQGVAISTTNTPDLSVEFADGTSLNIALADPLTVGDLISQINNATGNNGAITAALNAAGNGLVLTGTQPFSVQSLAGGSTAGDLGLNGASTGNTLNGLNINPTVINGQNLNVLLLKLIGQDLSPIASLSTLLSDLNGGNGVSFQGDSGNDLEIRAGDGTPIDIALGSSTTVGDVVAAINAASTKVKAILDPTGRLVLTDTTGKHTVPFTVASLNGSTAADDLGIDEAPISAPINLQYNLGDLASLSTVLTPTSPLSALNGGQGVQFATGGMPDLQVNFQNGTSVPVSLAGSMTISDVLSKLNAVTGLTAAINPSGVGLILTDGTPGLSPFTVTALNNSPAGAELGILGTGASNGSAVAIQGANIWNSVYLQANASANITLGVLLQAPSQGTMLTSDTPLSTLQGGQGIQFAAGGMPDLLVSLQKGTSIPVTLGGSTTIGAVLERLNAAGKQNGQTLFTAGLSQNGLGLVLNDRTSGPSAFTVTALNGSSAPYQLGILGIGDSTGTIQGASLSGASLGNNVFIQNASLGGSITIGGSVNATASFGFLGVGINNGMAKASASASFQLGNLEGAMLTSATLLSALNGGQGVQFAKSGMPDLQVNLQNGTSVPVTLAGSMTIGDVLAKLNALAPGKLTAAISASGLGLVLTDGTTGQSPFTVTALNGSPAAAQLGILGSGYNTLLSTGVSSYATILGTDVSGYSTITDLTNALTNTQGGVGLSVIAANPGPTNGQAGNGMFQVQLGNGPIYTVTIQNSAVANPGSLADLISNLNSSLKNAKDPNKNTVDLSTQVRALNSGGSVAFTLQGGDAQELTILNAGALGFSTRQTNYIVRPSVSLAANVNLPIAVLLGGSKFTGLDANNMGTGITLAMPSGGIPFDLDFGALAETPFTQYTTINLGQLNNLTGFNFTTFVTGLNLAVSFLNQTVAAAQSAGTNLDFLNQPLPVVNVSLLDILGYATSFSSFFTNLVNNPSDTLQNLANEIQSLLGPSATVGLGLDTSVTGTVLAPASGVLTGAANFQLVLDGGKMIPVTVPANPKNTSLAGLVNDINAALTTAGLGGQVVAETSGNYITLAATGSSPASSIVVQGIPAGDPAASQLGFSNGQTSNEDLRLDLKYQLVNYTNTFTPELNLSGGDSLAISGSTPLTLTAAATFQLSLGIGLTGNGAFTPFLYDYNQATQEGTGLVLTASALANPIFAKADLGPVGVSIKPYTNAKNPASNISSFAVFNDTGTNTSTNPAQIVIGLMSPAPGKPPTMFPGRHTPGELTFGAFGFVANAHIGVSLPIFVGAATTPLLTLTLAYDMTQPLSKTNPLISPNATTISNALSSQISLSSALSALSAGFDALFGNFTTGVDGQILGSNIPLIGPAIAKAATFLATLRSSFDAALNVATETLSNIEMSILTTFGPKSTFANALNPNGLLQPIPGNNLPTTDPNHYIVAQAQGVGAQFYVHLAQTLGAVEVPLSADLGLPGLGLKVSGDAYLQLGWDLQLGFGVNASEGIYIDSSAYNATTNPYPTSFKISPTITLANPVTKVPLSVTGTLGYLQIMAQDDPKTPTTFSGGFGITVIDPTGAGGDQHVTLAKLSQYGFSKVVDAGFTANANANIDLSTNFVDTNGNPDSALPQLKTTLQLAWTFKATTAAGIDFVAPTVAFNNVQMNLGTFLSSFVTPIFNDIDQVLSPIRPVINVLKAPIPVISALAGKNVTLADLFRAAGQTGIANFLDAVTAFDNLVQQVQKAGNQNNVWINLGSFKVSGPEAMNPNEANQLTPLPLTPAELAQIRAKIQQQEKQTVPGFAAGVTSLNSVTGTSLSDIISLPFLSNPGTVFQVLLGNDGGSSTPPSLFQLNLPKVTLGLKYTQNFPIPVITELTFGLVTVVLTGQISATFNFAFGFDTKGLSEYRASNYSSPSLIFDGFYIQDAPQDNQVVLNAGIAAGVEVGTKYIASVTVQGGVYATVNFHLFNDSNDDHLRFSAIANQILSNPLALFTVSGEFYGELQVILRGLYVFEKEFSIARVTLLQFTFNKPTSSRDVMTLAAAPSAKTQYGQGVTLTATVSPTSGATNAPVPKGTVEFVDTSNNNMVLGLDTLSPTGVATLSLPNLGVGDHVIKATYVSSNEYYSNYATLTEKISTAMTTTTVSAGGGPNPVYGQPVSLTATVAAGAATPTGTVQFSIDGAASGPPIPVSTANSMTTAVLNLTTPLPPGAHTISAAFTSGNTTLFLGSNTPQPINLRIAPDPTTTALIGDSSKPATFGQPVIFQVSPNTPGAGSPTGVVEFTNANTGAPLGSATLVSVNGQAQATVPLTALTVGTVPITATYQGDGYFLLSSNAMTVQQVIEEATTSMTLSAAATTVVVNNTVTLSATVSAQSPSQATPTGTVQFKVDGQNVGTPQPLNQAGTATLTTTTLALGSHTVSAVYVDPRGNFTGINGALAGSLSIIPKIATTSTVSISPPGSVKIGTPMTLQAIISPAPQQISMQPNGTVTFLDTTTNTVLGTARALDGLAMLSYTVTLQAGTHAIAASYAGDSNYLASTGSTTNLSVLSPTEVTWNQDNSTDPNQVSLREAITYADSNPGSTITFLPSLAGQTMVLSSPLPALSANVNIDALNDPGLTVKGTGVASVFVVNAGVSANISGLTITGGGSATGSGRVSGAGIANAGTLTLDDDTVTGNATYLSGGGVYNSGMLTVIDSTISNNSAAIGAGIANLGTLDVEDSTFSGNTAVGNNGRNGSGGGGAGGGGAGLGGALFNSNSGTATLVDSTISGNMAQGGKGAVSFVGSNSYGGNGGTSGYYSTASNYNGASRTGAFGGGGAGGSYNLIGVASPGGAGGFGGGGGGGGGSNFSSMGQAGGAGGYGGASGYAGGFKQGGTGGSGAGIGAGVFNNGGSVTITSSTIANNQSVGGAAAPGYLAGAGQGIGGGVFSLGGTVQIDSTIIAGNTASTKNPDVAGTFASAGFNLVGNTTGGSGFVSSDMLNANPMLGPLASNGGPTQTMALLPGSPALDAGDAANGALIDQRGAQRGPLGLYAGTGPDIGAYEASSSYLVTTTADTPDVGSLRAAVAWANVNVNPNNSPTLTNFIRFDTSGAFATAASIDLTMIGDTTVGPSSLAITGNVEIDGPVLTGGGVTISADANAPEMRLFYVTANGSLTLQDLTLTGGVARGFDGGDAGAGGGSPRSGGGGGGAAGLGGAVLNRGTLMLLDSTLTGNQAIGGAGGAGGPTNTSGGSRAGGGGGGLLGPGGTPYAGAGGGGGGGNYAPGNPGSFGGGGGGSFGYAGGSGGFGGGGGGSSPGFSRAGGSGGYGAGNGGGAGTAGSGGGGGAGLGGAVFNDGGTVTITNSTLAGNAVISGAGGAGATGGGQAGVAGSGFGGAVFNHDGTVTILNATLADNTADAGGALFDLGDSTSANTTATVAVTNTILAGTPASASDFQSATVNGGSVAVTGSADLIQNNPPTGGFPVDSTFITGVDPLLGPLADNGGATLTMALLPGSPALDAGEDVEAPLADQRGAQRGPFGLNAGSHTDIGAFEDTTSYLVTSTDDSSLDGTLRAAVLWADVSVNPLLSVPTANVVLFDPETFEGPATIDLSIVGDTTVGPSALPITGNVKIDGPVLSDGGVAISVASQASPMRLFYVGTGASLTLQDVTLSGGVAQSGPTTAFGGAVFNRGTLTLLDCTLTGNQAGQGGAVSNDGGQVSITNSTLTANTAMNPVGLYIGGAVFTHNGSVTILNSTLADNNAMLGGAVFAVADGTTGDGTATVQLTNSILAGTSGSATDFQGVALSGGSLVTGGDHNLIQNNPLGGAGILGFSGQDTITGVSPMLGTLGNYGGPTPTIPLLIGSPAIGAGLVVPGGVSTDQRGLPRSTSPGDSAFTVDLGAFQVQNYVVTSDLDFSVEGLTNLNDAVVEANAAGSGFVTFAPYLSDAPLLLTLLITGSVEIDGPVLASGGLTILPYPQTPSMQLFYVAPGASLTLQDLTLTGGMAQGTGGGAGQGGAVYNEGTLTLLDDTLTGNQAIGDTGANGQGGAVYNNGGQVTITNCTLTANTATGGMGGSGQGGAVYSDNGTVNVFNATIANNTADTGGALYVLGDGTSGNGTASVELINSILSGSPESANDFQSATVNGGSVDATGYVDLIENNGGAGAFPSYPINSSIYSGLDPMLAPLANNGGPTPTMALLPGSPAIDTGYDFAAQATDQRGAQRGPYGLNAGSHSDLGAFEDTSSYLVTTTADGTTEGTLRAAMAWANASANPLVIGPTANVVRFDTSGAFAQGGTIALTSVGDTTVGPSALVITGNVEIDGPSSTGQGVVISADRQSPPMRLFYVVSGASLTLQDLTLSGGVALGIGGLTGQGGAVFNSGALTLLNSTLIGNEALSDSDGAGQGGAVYNGSGQVSITDCTLAANTAAAGVGGIGQGGAVFSRNGTITLLSSTLAGNTAADGGALFVIGDGTSGNGTATVQVTNSILAGTPASVSDYQSATFGGGFVVASGDHDLIQNNPSVGGLPLYQTILFGVDPMLAPLADNGGPTQTMALIFGSPAIGAGNSNAAGEPATDQAGQPRIVNGGIDLGAFEFQPTPTTISVSASDLSPSLGEAVTFTAVVAATANDTTPTGTVQFLIDGQASGDPVPLVGGVAQSDPNSTLGLGTHVVTAQYVSNGPFASGTAQLAGSFVVSTATTTTVSTSAPSVQYGQAVTLTATVFNETLGSGTPAGMVDFTDETTGVDLTPGGVALVNGTASVLPSDLNVGTHEIIATFLGSAGFYGSTSVPQSVLVTTVRASTMTTVGVSMSSVVYGQGVSFSASVTSALGVPEGSVDFFDLTTDTDLGAVPLVAGTASTPSITTLAGGQHTITATYLGNQNFEDSFGQTSVTVETGATTTALSAPSSAEYDQEVTLSSTVTAASTGAQQPTGSVDFMDTTTGTDLGSVPLVNGQASLDTITTLGIGSHSITATYSGDGNYASSTDTFDVMVLNAGTTTVVQATPNPTAPGGTVVLQAMVTLVPASTATLSGMVQFGIDGVNTGSPVALSGGFASLSVSAPPAGNHTVTASFIGDSGIAPSSATLAGGLNVQASGTITVTESKAKIGGVLEVTFNATVNSSGPNTPTGTVTFTIDGVDQPPVNVDPSGQASLTLTSLPTGSLAFFATYSGDANTASSTTATVLNASQLSVTSSHPSLFFGEKVTYTAVVKAAGGATGTPTGQVIFSVDGVAQTPVKLNSKGQAVLSLPGLGVGPHTVTAQYAGNTQFGGSSDNVSQQVVAGSTTTTLHSSLTSSKNGQTVTFTATVAALAPAVGKPTGEVVFYVDGKAFQTVMLNNAVQAVLMLNALSVGPHKITADYQGDGNFEASNSKPISQTVHS